MNACHLNVIDCLNFENISLESGKNAGKINMRTGNGTVCQYICQERYTLICNI